MGLLIDLFALIVVTAVIGELGQGRRLGLAHKRPFPERGRRGLAGEIVKFLPVLFANLLIDLEERLQGCPGLGRQVFELRRLGFKKSFADVDLAIAVVAVVGMVIEAGLPLVAGLVHRHQLGGKLIGRHVVGKGEQAGVGARLLLESREKPVTDGHPGLDRLLGEGIDDQSRAAAIQVVGRAQHRNDRGLAVKVEGKAALGGVAGPKGKNAAVGGGHPDLDGAVLDLGFGQGKGLVLNQGAPFVGPGQNRQGLALLRQGDAQVFQSRAGVLDGQLQDPVGGDGARIGGQQDLGSVSVAKIEEAGNDENYQQGGRTDQRRSFQKCTLL